MILQFHDAFGNVQRVHATSLAILDNYGQPLLVALQQDHQRVIVHQSRPGKAKEFQKALEIFGLKQTHIVASIDVPAAGDVRIG